MKIDLTVDEFTQLMNFEQVPTMDDSTLDELVKRFKINEDKIGAIILIRRVRGWGLIEAKSYCEKVWATQ